MSQATLAKALMLSAPIADRSAVRITLLPEGDLDTLLGSDVNQFAQLKLIHGGIHRTRKLSTDGRSGSLPVRGVKWSS